MESVWCNPLTAAFILVLVPWLETLVVAEAYTYVQKHFAVLAEGRRCTSV